MFLQCYFFVIMNTPKNNFIYLLTKETPYEKNLFNSAGIIAI